MKKFGVIIFFCLTTLGVSAQWNTASMLRAGKSAIMFDDYVSAIENFNYTDKALFVGALFFPGIGEVELG